MRKCTKMGTQMEGAKPPKIHPKSTFDSRGLLWSILGSPGLPKWSPREPKATKMELKGAQSYQNGAQGCQNDPPRTPEQPQMEVFGIKK